MSEELALLDADAETRMKPTCPDCGTPVFVHRMKRHREGGGCKMQREANAARERGLEPVRQGWIAKYLQEADVPTERCGADMYDKQSGKRISDGVRTGLWAPKWAIEIIRRCRYRPSHGKIEKDEILRFLREAKTDLGTTMTLVKCITRREEAR